jgi:galactokinase
MSSSSALIIAAFLAIADANELYERADWPAEFAERHVLAGYLGTIENGQSFGALAGDRGVGTFGGSEDHTAILCSEANHLSQYAYCPVRFERKIRLPGDCLFAIGSSGVVAAKTGSAREKYNAASQLASAVAQLWREKTGRDDPHLAAALHSEPDAAARLRAMVDSPALAARLEHFIIENEEVLPAAGDALAAGDMVRFGQLVDRSQKACEELLGNQIAETAFLASSARQEGALAASAFGAGFGGSVWALVEKAHAEDFLAAWAASYRRQYPAHASSAEFFLTAAGPAAIYIG